MVNGYSRLTYCHRVNSITLKESCIAKALGNGFGSESISTVLVDHLSHGKEASLGIRQVQLFHAT